MPKPTFNIHNPLGLKLLTRLRLGLSHLNYHRFNHNFKDCINPLCLFSLEVESTVHFFLHCHNFVNIRNTLFFFRFFNCYLAVPWPTLGHSPGDSLTNLMLITAFCTYLTQRSLGALLRGWIPEPGGAPSEF